MIVNINSLCNLRPIVFCFFFSFDPKCESPLWFQGWSQNWCPDRIFWREFQHVPFTSFNFVVIFMYFYPLFYHRNDQMNRYIKDKKKYSERKRFTKKSDIAATQKPKWLPKDGSSMNFYIRYILILLWNESGVQHLFFYVVFFSLERD